MDNDANRELERAIAEITEIARGFGLDFFPMRYEICPPDILYTFGAYGMPTRFSHWSFGKAFQRMKMHYDLGLSKIYELVINSNPCYAFLLEGNSLIQNKLIVAHVLAHCDFFKNNFRFASTSRDMVESMSASAERIRAYELKHGKEVVEQFLDAVLAIQEHIDPSLIKPGSYKHPGGRTKQENETSASSARLHAESYADLWALDDADQQTKHKQDSLSRRRKKRFPESPEKDIMLFIQEHSTELEEWQRDIMTMLREEMLYYWPQLETKIMNEGWASYWHMRILREMDLSDEETIEFAKLNASVVSPSKTGLNPYFIGYKMFEDIEKRWNEPSVDDQQKYGRVPGQGRQKIFEVRELDADISFLRNYLTKDLMERLDLYLFQKQGHEYKITEVQWEAVRDYLVSMRVNGGFPYLMVEDGDYERQGELFIKHYYEGIELDVKYVEKTMPYLYLLWGRPVHLQTMIDEQAVIFSYNGERVRRKLQD